MRRAVRCELALLARQTAIPVDAIRIGPAVHVLPDHDVGRADLAEGAFGGLPTLQTTPRAPRRNDVLGGAGYAGDHDNLRQALAARGRWPE